MNHIMIDVESLGTKPGCIILSIGAVMFDMATGETGKKFYVNIDAVDSQKQGLTIEASTVWWWLGQDAKAKEALEKSRVSLETALNSFEAWLEDNNSVGCQIWANAPSFDLSVLGYAFTLMHMKTPWFYRQERCVRTLVSFAPGIKQGVKNTLAHDALSDCLYQIEYCSAIWNYIN